ncbi:dTDP-glucose 4,6-dehydratase [Brevundimonas lutea]|uniref:dTDP-glucose 4,6-dehydratase n=1 Tax=Brevundimonas lutea TaxID=2293980 RepID=UPI000F038427|nr:dTDP-glucose 4,6-dehydratase [Brevundimonas lutea]
MKLLITGGAGFIGSAVVRRALDRGLSVVTLDALTYSGSLENLAEVRDQLGHAFEHADISDAPAVAAILDKHQPDAILNLAAESHVDRSIDGPLAFMHTNVTGTAVMLEAARRYWQALPGDRAERFRFQHISTDEVFGSLEPGDPAFDENSRYQPNSPYAASKAGSDMLVRAWRETHGLPTLLTNCSNNYGPRQHPEKLIPTVILNAAAGRPIPVYGQGTNIRDWLHVDDHAEALLTVLERGRVGQTYGVGGAAERTNIDLVRLICAELDRLRPDGAPHDRLIEFVTDRPGHDRRYAIDITKIDRDLGWRPATTLEDGIAATVAWYLDNPAWVDSWRARGFGGDRLGLG